MVLADGLRRIVARWESAEQENEYRPKSDSPATVEFAASAGAHGEAERRMLDRMIVLGIAAATDHLLGMVELLASRHGKLSLYVVSRACLETSCRVSYLLAKGIDFNERLRRASNERFWCLSEEIRATQLAGEKTADQQDELLRLLDDARQRGEQVTPANGYRPPSIGEPRPTSITLIAQSIGDNEAGAALYASIQA